MSIDNRARLGPIAMALMIEEAGDEKPTGAHLDLAIAKLQKAGPIGIMFSEISESILRLRSMIMGSVLTDNDEIDKAMRQLHHAIGDSLVDASRAVGGDAQKLSYIDRLLTDRTEQAFVPTEQKQIDKGDRER